MKVQVLYLIICLLEQKKHELINLFDCGAPDTEKEFFDVFENQLNEGGDKNSGGSKQKSRRNRKSKKSRKNRRKSNRRR